MATLSTLFKISFKGNACIPGLSEDTLRQLAESLTIVSESVNDNLEIVTSTPGHPVKVEIDSFGKLSLVGKLNGVLVDYLPGDVILRKGPQTAINPPVGWAVLIPESAKLNANAVESSWTILVCEFIGVLNTFSS